MTPRVTVLVVSWNTRELLRACLTSLFASPGAADWEVIVVDNGSRDGTPEMVRRAFPGVRLLVNASNEGFARAVNQGFRETGAEYVLLLNSDVRILDDAVSRCAELLDAAPRAAAVGCRQIHQDGSPQTTSGAFPTVAELVLHAYDPRPLLPWLGRPRATPAGAGFDERPQAVDCVMGSFLMVRAAAVEPGALLDEGYFFFGEEIDLCYRLRRDGWLVLFHPGVAVEHRHGGSSRAAPAWALDASRRARLKLLYTWRGRTIGWLANALLLPRVLAAAAARFPSDPRGRSARWAALRFHLAALVRPTLLAGSWAAPGEPPRSTGDQSKRAGAGA